jgi:DNA polymerase sigma
MHLKSDESLRRIGEKMVKEGYRVECILTAKVPIVKFDHPKNGFRGE